MKIAYCILDPDRLIRRLAQYLIHPIINAFSGFPRSQNNFAVTFWSGVQIEVTGKWLFGVIS